MKHKHKECRHEKLTYCKKCDVVECECGKEWGKDNVIVTPVVLPYSVPTYPWYDTGTGFTPSPYTVYY